MNLKTKIVGSALVASLAMGVAAPASAAGWNWASQFRQQINQIERQADSTRGISRNDARQLDWQVDRLKAKYDQYARGGFNRDEVTTMRNMIDNVQRMLAAKARESDNRYAYNTYRSNDRYNAYGNYAYNDRSDRTWQGGYHR